MSIFVNESCFLEEFADLNFIIYRLIKTFMKFTLFVWLNNTNTRKNSQWKSVFLQISNYFSYYSRTYSQNAVTNLDRFNFQVNEIFIVMNSFKYAGTCDMEIK